MKAVEHSLVNPPSPGIYSWIGLKLLPLSLAYLASTLEQENHRVKILDLQVAPKKELKENLKNRFSRNNMRKPTKLMKH